MFLWYNVIKWNILRIEKLYYFKYLDYFETLSTVFFKVSRIFKLLSLKHLVCNSSCDHDMPANQSTCIKTNIASKYEWNSSASLLSWLYRILEFVPLSSVLLLVLLLLAIKKKNLTSCFSYKSVNENFNFSLLGLFYSCHLCGGRSVVMRCVKDK